VVEGPCSWDRREVCSLEVEVVLVLVVDAFLEVMVVVVVVVVVDGIFASLVLLLWWEWWRSMAWNLLYACSDPRYWLCLSLLARIFFLHTLPISQTKSFRYASRFFESQNLTYRCFLRVPRTFAHHTDLSVSHVVYFFLSFLTPLSWTSNLSYEAKEVNDSFSPWQQCKI
jgi:hypothetical protein